MNHSGSTKSSEKSSLREWLFTIVIALVLAFVIRGFIAEPFIVVGASMDPTFATGNFLIVDRVTYRFQTPSRGDILIFEYPNDPSKDYIKRIIGLPNETVQIKDGQVTIINSQNPSGLKLNEPYIAPVHASHDNLTVKLGATEYFVMGDNRLQSSDSRAWGPLDKKFIVGRPIVRLLPVNQISILPGEFRETK